MDCEEATGKAPEVPTDQAHLWHGLLHRITSTFAMLSAKICIQKSPIRALLLQPLRKYMFSFVCLFDGQANVVGCAWPL